MRTQGRLTMLITMGRFGREADIERDVDWIEPFVGGASP